MFYKDLINCFIETSKEILGENLVGIYLHGSAVMGCFNPQKSDLDFIIVVNHDMTDEEKIAYLMEVVKLNREAPKKGLELSIVKKEVCNPFVYPTPFELHFSPFHLKSITENVQNYIETVTGTDKDLAAHFMIINHYGVVLYGSNIFDVFGEVPRNDYIDSIWSDVECAKEDILENPMYMTLNLCRVLAYVKDSLVVSKKEGGMWGIQTVLQKFQRLIQDALRCYETEEEMCVEEENALEFVSYMIGQIQRYI